MVNKALLFVSYLLQACAFILLGMIVSLFVTETTLSYLIIGVSVVSLLSLILYFYYDKHRRRKKA